MRVCQSGHGFPQESQSELFEFLSCFDNGEMSCFDFCDEKNFLFPPSHFTTFFANYKHTVQNS